MEKSKQKNYILLHLLLLFLSFSGVFSKMAANYDVLSYGFILCYGGVLLVLFIYAILWQQILKRIPLTIAYCNVFLGIYLMVTADE